MNAHETMKVSQAMTASVHTIDAMHVPWFCRFKRTHEHFIKSHRVGSVIGNDVVRIDNVASRLAHFLAVFAEDHSLVD